VPWSPNATVKINGTAVTNYTLEGVQISMGRDDVQQQSSAGFATIDFLNLPYTDVEIFDTIQVTLDNFTGVDTTIFTGLVTDVSVSVLDAGMTGLYLLSLTLLALNGMNYLQHKFGLITQLRLGIHCLVLIFHQLIHLAHMICSVHLQHQNH